MKNNALAQNFLHKKSEHNGEPYAPCGEGKARSKPTSAVDHVQKFQGRIAKAWNDGEQRKVAYLQNLLTHSHSAKVLAVLTVTFNRGAKTPGIDNVLWESHEDKYNAALSLNPRGYTPRPLKRIYIPKRNGELRPLSIPTMKDRANTSTSVDTKRDEVEIRKQYVTGSSTQPFGVLFPELLEEWNYELNGNLNPDSFSVSSGISVWWKCKNCGYEWKTRIATRTQGVGCIKCGFAKRTQHRIANMIKNKGSLADNFPEIAAEWHPYKNKELSPKQVMSGSGKKCWWLCKKCGTEWEAVIMHRVRGKCGCPTCKKENKKKE